MKHNISGQKRSTLNITKGKKKLEDIKTDIVRQYLISGTICLCGKYVITFVTAYSTVFFINEIQVVPAVWSRL